MACFAMCCELVDLFFKFNLSISIITNIFMFEHFALHHLRLLGRLLQRRRSQLLSGKLISVEPCLVEKAASLQSDCSSPSPPPLPTQTLIKANCCTCVLPSSELILAASAQSGLAMVMLLHHGTLCYFGQLGSMTFSVFCY